MGDGVVTFGVQKLWDFLSQQSERFRGVDEQVYELRLELGRLQSLLNDADAKKNDSERVKNFLEDVKDIIYDAEDTIESFLLKQERSKEKGIKKGVKRVAFFLVDRQKFSIDIKSITKEDLQGDCANAEFWNTTDHRWWWLFTFSARKTKRDETNVS